MMIPPSPVAEGNRPTIILDEIGGQGRPYDATLDREEMILILETES